MSVPRAMCPMPAATAAAPPPLDPPGVSSDRVGCVCVCVCRHRAGCVVNQRMANVGALLRPSSTAPARTTFSTAGLLNLAMRFSYSLLPSVVANPAWSMFILTVTGCRHQRAITRACSNVGWEHQQYCDTTAKVTMRRSSFRQKMNGIPPSTALTALLASLAIPFVCWFYTKSCDDYVPKPFSPRQLLAKIRQYLS